MDIESSKKFKKFLYNLFELDIPPNVILFRYIDPYTISDLIDEEKEKAEDMLIEALKTKIENKWLWGIEEINSKRGYNFLLSLFNNEKNIYNKTLIANYLLMMDKEAPVLEFLVDIIESKESDDIKLKALEGLYSLVDYISPNEYRNKLFLSTLYRNMSNPINKIRLNVYSKLIDHYDMRNFTPNNDSIKRILQEKHTRTEYQQTAKDFKQRVQSKEITTFSIEKVINFIHHLPDKSSAIAIDDCVICKEIPDSSHADITAGHTLNAFKTKLETSIIFAYYDSCIMRCPNCGRLYDYNYHYEYYACSSSDEDEYLKRINKKDAISKVKKFVKSYQFKKIITCENFLKISY